MSKALEEEGINVTIFRSKDGKMRGNAMEVLDEATKELFQGMVDEVDEVFVDAVARFRGISKQAVHEPNASVYMGRPALATARKIVEWVNSVSVSVELGGGRIIKKK